jgi:outer membrane protein
LISGRALILIILLTLTSVAGFSQTNNWTLEQCVEHALKSNIGIKRSELNAGLREADYTQSKFNLAPNLNGQASHNYNFGRNVDPFTNQFINQKIRSNTLGLNSSVTIFNGFQTQNRIRQGKYDFLASEQDVLLTRNNLSLQVANLFLQILFNQELLEVSRRQVAASRQQLERTQKLLDAGRGTAGDVLDVTAQLANEELNFVTAENQVTTSYLNLTQLLDLKPGTLTIVSPGNPEPGLEPDKTADQIYTDIVSGRPEVQSQALRLQSAKMNYRLAQGTRSPRLTLGANVSTLYSESRKTISASRTDTIAFGFTGGFDPVYILQNFPTTTVITPFNTQLNDNFGRSIGFTLSVPIFNAWQVNTNVKKAKLSMQLAEYNLIDAQNQLYKDIYQAFNDLRAARARYDASLKSLEAQTQSFRMIQQRFDLGLMNSLDYANAKNNLLRIESSLLQAKYELIFKSKIIDFYQGKPIRLE